MSKGGEVSKDIKDCFRKEEAATTEESKNMTNIRSEKADFRS